MTKPTKRDVKTELETVKTQTDNRPAGAYRTEDGRYFDRHGNRITDISDVVFVVPPGLWKDEWEDFELNVTED